MTQAQQPICECVTTCGDCRKPGEKCGYYKVNPEAHPDDAAVDALAAVMKAKLAKQRAKGYGGWSDKAQCSQQRLSDMLRAHVDKGDPVDVANFCAFLVARSEGITAQDAPLPLLLRDIARDFGISVPQACAALKPWGDYSTNSAVTSEMAKKLREAFPTPAHPAEGVPAQANRDAVIQNLTNAGVLEHDGCGVFIASGDASELIDACMTLPLSTHPTQQGLDAQALKQSFREYLSVSEHIDAGGHAMDSIATDLTRIVLAEEEVSAVIARRVHCNTSGQSGEDAENIRAAAQAKQGGV